MISVRQVTKRYGDVVALRDVSLDFPARSCTALLGSSGSGKTTLLLLIAGLLELDSGEIAIGNQVVTNCQKSLAPHKRNIGLAFQNSALWPHMTVRQHLEFCLSRWSNSERCERVHEVLHQLDLLLLQDRFPSQLSGGEAKRLALARALVRRPSYLLLDEPFNGMDPPRRHRVVERLAAAVREARPTTVVVSQHPEEIRDFVDGTAILENGALTRPGTDLGG